MTLVRAILSWLISTVFAVDKLKIAQSFVHDLPTSANNPAIVQVIIQMANSPDLEVIAEGIETPAQHDFLIAHGCVCTGLFLRPTTGNRGF